MVATRAAKTRDDVEADRSEDGVAEAFGRRHEFADDGTDQGETDGELEPAKMSPSDEESPACGKSALGTRACA